MERPCLFFWTPLIFGDGAKISKSVDFEQQKLPLERSHAQKVPHFWNPQDVSFHMVVPWIWVPIPKTQVNWPNAKKRVFCHFWLSLCKKISNGRQSDNFDPRRSAYGSSESLCPKFSETLVKKVSIFKIEGVMPLQSRVIMICVTPKSCFSAFWREKRLSRPNRPFWTP